MRMRTFAAMGLVGALVTGGLVAASGVAFAGSCPGTLPGETLSNYPVVVTLETVTLVDERADPRNFHCTYRARQVTYEYGPEGGGGSVEVPHTIHFMCSLEAPFSAQTCQRLVG